VLTSTQGSFLNNFKSKDIANKEVTTPFTFAEQMNMEQLRKQKLYKKVSLLKKFATSITKFIKKFMNGLTLILIILEEPPQKNKLKLLKIFLQNFTKTNSWKKER
jgi:hypothetical protein